MATTKKPLKIATGVLQALIGIGAIPAGAMLIIDPSGGPLGMTTDALAGSPFPNFLIPGIFLLLVNGIGSLIGAVLTFRKHPQADVVAIGLGAFLMAWIVVQVWSMGLPVHWLQALYLVLGMVELGLGWLAYGHSSSR